MPGERTIEDLFHNLPSPSSDFEQRAKKFRDERNNAWDEFLDLSAQAGYNIKNTLANRALFMSGFESGKEKENYEQKHNFHFRTIPNVSRSGIREALS